MEGGSSAEGGHLARGALRRPRPGAGADATGCTAGGGGPRPARGSLVGRVSRLRELAFPSLS
eukprot:8557675-Pyramimonas_sp.AAC.1